MQERVTLQKVAERVGLHFTTVAEALKNSARVKPSTRAMIQAVAREMGYVPDPMLSALSAYRKANKPPIYHETLAWITSSPTADGWRQSFSKFYEGAAQRAAELGFRLEEYWIKRPGVTSKHASRHLYSRGIRGLLIAPVSVARGHLSLDWNQFASVTLGYTLTQPKLNLVSTTHYRAVIKAVRHLKALGHRRIGWAGSSAFDERIGRLWTSGFLSELKMTSGSDLDALFSVRPFEPKSFMKWFKQFRPEAILTSGGKGTIVPLITWLRENGYGVPDDVSVAIVNLQEEGEISGIVEPNELVGRTAIDLITRMLQNGERGIPEYPLLQLIEGKWNEGKTIARANLKTKHPLPKGPSLPKSLSRSKI